MATFDFLKDPEWRNAVWNNAFGKSFWGFFAGAAFFGAICWLVKGPDSVRDALFEDLALLVDLTPRVIVALSIAALIWVMMPRDKMAALVGQDSGIRGLMIATLAGAVTPGGPSSAYALLATAAISGADRGTLITYITAWALLGVQRILIWDVPFMGAEFAMMRFAVCIPLPIIAGLIARRLPITYRVKDTEL